MYRQLLIAGLVAGASLTAGGIAAVWTMEKSPAELHSELGHKLKPIARSVQTASWSEHGGTALAPLAVAPAAAARHAVPVVAESRALPVLLATATSAADQPDLPAASRGARHCALEDNCTPALAGDSTEGHASGRGAPLAATGTLPLAGGASLPLASIGAPAAQPGVAPAAPSAPAPSVTMLLADTTPVAPTTIVEATEYGRVGGPRSVLGQAQEVPGNASPGTPPPASNGPWSAPGGTGSVTPLASPAPGEPAGSPSGTPFVTLPESQPAGTPSGTPDIVSAPIPDLGGGPQLVPQLVPTSSGPDAPLFEQVVSAAAESAVGEPSTNILLLIAMLGAAVMVRRRAP